MPAPAFLDDYAHLPIHTVQDTIDLMRPAALTAAEVVATAMDHLRS